MHGARFAASHRLRRLTGVASAVLLGIACSGPTSALPPTGGAPSSGSPRAAADSTLVAPADIAASGRLRVAMISTELGLIAKNATTGELTGVNVDVARELARRLGVSFSAIDVTTYPAMVAAVKAGTVDLVIVSPLPEREVDFDFTASVVELDLTYLVPSGATVKSAADADRTGVRIVVRKGTSVDAALSQSVKLAEIVRVEGSLDNAVAALRSGSGDILAGARPNLLSVAVKFPGSVITADRFSFSPFAFAVPKGKTDLLRAATQFAKEIKASDFVKQAIARAGAQGVQPTP